MESDFGVKMGQEEYKLYRDNCVVDETISPPRCPRLCAAVGVDSSWLVAARLRLAKAEKNEGQLRMRDIRMNKEKMKRN